jgi:hypothetical protein
MIVNSNKTFSAWAEIFGDPVAVVDGRRGFQRDLGDARRLLRWTKVGGRRSRSAVDPEARNP